MVGFILSDHTSITPSQIKLARNVISYAFYNDPLMIHLFPQPKERKCKLPLMMKLILRIGIKYGIVHATSHNLEGIAVWFPSNKAKITPWMGLLNGGLSYFFKLGRKTIKKQNNLYNYVHSKRKEHLPLNYWYLSIIGINPLYQGKGFSRVLFNSMFNQIDEQELPCFLDTNNKKNLLIYKRFGFRIVEEYQIPETNVINWAMIRK
ncbi:MAG: hypothetical protein ACFE9Q_14400 [Candidatus Hodarchaeota archaeon]